MSSPPDTIAGWKKRLEKLDPHSSLLATVRTPWRRHNEKRAPPTRRASVITRPGEFVLRLGGTDNLLFPHNVWGRAVLAHHLFELDAEFDGEAWRNGRRKRPGDGV